MERLRTRRVLIARSVHENASAARRLEALLARVDADHVETVDGAQVEAALRELGPREQLERGGLARRGEPKQLVAFTTFADGDVFPGYSWRELRDGARERKRNGVLCHSAIEIQSTVGCAYDCTYCPYGAFVCARLDVERFADDVAALTLSRPAQTLYKLNNRTDTLALEPEHGLAKALVERFATLDGRYLLLYSKGDAVDHLVDVEHRKKTIASFTLTPAPVAELLEKSAPPPAARLAAIGKLARAGYPIRVRFSPVVPVRGWREAYRELALALAAVAVPELVTLWTLSMIELADLERIVPLDALDPVALDAMRAGEEAMRGQKGAPLPPALRAELYRDLAAMVREACPTTPVSLCLETPDVWDAVGTLVVPRNRTSFVCNCGPRATPGSLVALRAR